MRTFNRQREWAVLQTKEEAFAERGKNAPVIDWQQTQKEGRSKQPSSVSLNYQSRI
jgi:hypothetical protein